MQIKRWLHKILTTIAVHLGMYVAGRVDYDILCEVTAKYAEKVNASQTYDLYACGICGGGLTYEQLKKVEDEWVKEKIIF